MNGLLILGVAAAGCAIGYLWLHRVISADPEPDQRAWRYRDVRAVAMPTDGRGLTRGRRGRRIGRLLIAVAAGLIAAMVLAWVSRPVMFGRMFQPAWWSYADVAIPIAAVIGSVVGLVWMIRIHRANPEPDQRAWRYRERD